MLKSSTRIRIDQQRPAPGTGERLRQIRRHERLSVAGARARDGGDQRARSAVCVPQIHADASQCLEQLGGLLRVRLASLAILDHGQGPKDREPQLLCDLLRIPDTSVEAIEQERQQDPETETARQSARNDEEQPIRDRPGGRHSSIEQAHVGRGTQFREPRFLVRGLQLRVNRLRDVDLSLPACLLGRPHRDHLHLTRRSADPRIVLRNPAVQVVGKDPRLLRHRALLELRNFGVELHQRGMCGGERQSQLPRLGSLRSQRSQGVGEFRRAANGRDRPECHEQR